MIVLCVRFLRHTPINGITLFPFIFLRHKTLKNNKTLLNHEKIHLRQQAELLVVFFYLWYGIEFLYWYYKLGNKDLAYRHICFEREAYAQEEDLTYLKQRKHWSFWKYRA